MIKRKNSSSPSHVEHAITSEDLLGKDVIDPSGTFVGVADILYLDPKSLEFIGISVDKGFLRTGLVIGAEYIREVTAHAVLLNTRPVFRIKGMSVFDAHGKKLGTVKEVVLSQSKNEIEELLVATSKLSKKAESVPASIIDRIDENVFLKE